MKVCRPELRLSDSCPFRASLLTSTGRSVSAGFNDEQLPGVTYDELPG